MTQRRSNGIVGHDSVIVGAFDVALCGIVKGWEGEFGCGGLGFAEGAEGGCGGGEGGRDDEGGGLHGCCCSV